MTGEDSKEVDAGECCSFPTYFNLWKYDFPEPKVSWPVEDICKDCYAFANRHRYLTNHIMGRNDDDGDSNVNGNGDGNDNGNGNGKHSNDRCSDDGENNDGSNNVSNVIGVRPLTT